jgi:osmotically-inducible protein OsmY
MPASIEEGTMKSDSDIKHDVEEELRADPELDATDIGVAVTNGVVALTGFVKSSAEKLEAEGRGEARGGRAGSGKRSAGSSAQ